MDWPRHEPRPLWWEAAPNHLSHGTSFSTVCYLHSCRKCHKITW
jgi:hypothetical protein